MPVISRFYGISILMFFNEHNPPHFHAKYEGQIAVLNIQNGHTIAGSLPPNARRLVGKWIKLHRQELLTNWRKAQKDGDLKPIDPLL